MHFTTTITLDDQAIILRPWGELDIATAPDFKETITGAIEAHPQHVTIDLTHLTFLDAAGIHAILDSQFRAAVEGVQLVVVNATPVAARVLRICGILFRGVSPGVS